MSKKIIARILQASIFIIVFCILSCTRNVTEKVRVSLSSGPGSQTLSEPKVIIINITGPGITPSIYYFWEKCQQEPAILCPPNSLTTPTEFEFEIPMGTNRLFQVLSAYEDSVDFNVSFQYGDSVRTLSSTNETVSLSLAPIGGAGQQFDFYGRYSPDGTDFPSGKVSSFYTPGSGKPRMKIEDVYMFDGYFKFFGIHSANFDYVLTKLDGTSQEIFSNVNSDTTSFPNSNHILKINFPTYYRFDSGASTWEGIGTRDFILGFFGPSGYTSGKKVCYQTSFTNDFTPTYCKTDTDCDGSVTTNFNLDWNGNAAPTESTVTDDVIARITGTGTSCLSGTNAVDYFDFDPDHYVQFSEDKTLTFDGPFKFDGITNNFINVTDGTDTTVSWSYISLPGGSNIFDGVDVYDKINSPTSSIDNYLLDCSRLPADGWNLHANGTSVTDTTDPVTVDLTSRQGTPHLVVVCPYKVINSVKKYLVGAAQDGVGN